MNQQSNRGSHLPTTNPTESGTYVAVGVKHCCGVLFGDECGCAAFAAEARDVFARPIMARPANQWNRDPATALGVALHRAQHPNRVDGCVLCAPTQRVPA